MWCYGKKDEYMKMVPSGMLPAAILDGKLVTESDVILDTLETRFPEPSLRPLPRAADRPLFDNFLKLERQLFSSWMMWLCRVGANDRVQAAFEATLDQVDQSLAVKEGPYFMGAFSLVDCVFAPFLERIAASIVYYKGLKVRGGRWHHLNQWYAAMEQRGDYKGIMSDYHTHVHDLPPQLGGCLASGTPEQQAAAAEIDGIAGHGLMPVAPQSDDDVEPPNGWEQDVSLACLEAAAALLRHHTKVLALAQRPGQVALMEPALQRIADSLLEAEAIISLNGLPVTDASELELMQTALGLRYVCDRINVPRDMHLPAARQLRARLNHLSSLLACHAKGLGSDVVLGQAAVVARRVELPTKNRKDQDPAAFGWA